MNFKKGFTLIELLVVVAIVGILSSVVLSSLNSARVKSRDSARISQLRQIKYALELYYNINGKYPTCLHTGTGCVTVLENTAGVIKNIPKDPKSGLAYTYAARGSGTNCSSYHLGASLEDKTNKALLIGADATPVAVCTGSAAGFSGLSYAVGGQQCNATAGTAQPTAAANGETCYDLIP
ncbi:MAG: prepilin-type N-terminal cleavage/methylation domain-containing protein [Candidatus Paceibacterota bacterium]|jgi:prepilin-type N-terminal cleavage/methylation domain-containing protein